MRPAGPLGMKDNCALPVRFDLRQGPIVDLPHRVQRGLGELDSLGLKFRENSMALENLISLRSTRVKSSSTKRSGLGENTRRLSGSKLYHENTDLINSFGHDKRCRSE